MTKLVTIVAAVAVLGLGACAVGPAQSESVVKGDKTFTHAQTK